MNILNEFDVNDINFRYAVDDSPDSRNFGLHIHDTCEIFYYIDGADEYLVEGSVYPLAPGNLLIMRPGEAHCVRITSPVRYERFAVNFPLSLFDEIDPERRLMTPFTERTLGQGNIFLLSGLEGYFKDMISGKDSYEKRLRLTAGILHLLTLICSEYDLRKTEKPRKKNLSEQIASYVNEHLFEELSIPFLASEFYLSESQFRRLFIRTTGAPPWEYITAKRLNEANRLLREGVSAKEVSERCGFREYSSFYRAYKKRFGSCPRES